MSWPLAKRSQRDESCLMSNISPGPVFTARMAEDRTA